jgi:hypothetical protein
MKTQTHITFHGDKYTTKFIISLFPDFDKHCIYCGKEITPKNLGSVTKKGFMCTNFVCIIQMLESEGKI